MSTHRPAMVWPFMTALTFLFALSVTAPRTWETVAQRTTLRKATGGSRVPFQTTMPSLIVSDLAAASPVPRTAGEFVVAPAAASSALPAVEATPQLAALPSAGPRLSAAPKLSEIEPPATPPEPKPTTAVKVTPTIETLLVQQPPIQPKHVAAKPTPVAPSIATPLNHNNGTTTAPVPVAPSLNSPRLSGGLPPSKTPAPHSVTPPSTVAPIVPQVTVVAPTHPAVTAVIVTRSQLPEPEKVATRPVEPARSVPVLEPAAPVVKSWWPEPVDLYSRLEKLRARPETRTWADRAEAVLRRLSTASDASSPEVIAALDDLRTVAADPVVVDESRLEPAAAVELRLARHALLRRVDVWESLAKVLRGPSAIVDAVATDDVQPIELCLAELESQTASAGETGRQWRSYLLVDSLRQTVKNGGPGERRAVAREVLARLRRAGANAEHGEFLRQGPFAKLDGLLRSWTEEDVNPQRLLAGIERVEQGGLPSDGRALAEESRLLHESSDASKKQLAVWLTSHYRNSNIRVTFSPELLNRLLPDSLKRQQQVNDTVLGLPTRGWSTARTGVSVRFLPSRDQLAMRLEAQGVISAQTRTSSGPVRIFNHSNSTFAAQKDLLLSPTGIKINPAVALSNNNSKLRAVESDFDGIPIIGSIVASMAIDKHDEKKPAALREMAWKVARNVERNFDSDIEQQMKNAGTGLKDRVMAPLEKMRLTPEVVDLQTLEDRATIRLRIAGDDQLAANTPRPRAYSDNVFSIQVHQSAANNIVDRLSLQGQRYTPAELYKHVVTQLNLPGEIDISKLPPDVELQFAATDPLTVRYDEGRIELRLALDSLTCGERSWTNFTVRVQFKPEMIDGHMCFVRDGIVRLSGSKLRTTEQISLRTVCAKVFPDDLRANLWPEDLRTDPRFADLDIEQIDIRDGWLGVSVGPRRTVNTAIAPATPTQR